MRIGGLIGIAGIMLEAPHVNIQALTAGVLQPLNAATLYEAYRSDVRVSWIALREIAGFLSDVIPLVAEAQFASVEHRIARHLLDLSTPGPDGVLVSTVTHQQLADAVGTVREVVVREVRSLREKGAIQTVPGGIAILDPDGLAAQAQVEHKSLHARLLPT